MASDPQDSANSSQKPSLPSFQHDTVGQTAEPGSDRRGPSLVEDLPNEIDDAGPDPLAALDAPPSGNPASADEPAIVEPASQAEALPQSERVIREQLTSFQDYVFSDRMADWLLVYVQRNPNAYAALYRRMTKRRNTMLLSWSFPAFFFTPAWFLYRRMWLLAIVLISGPFLLTGLAPTIFANSLMAVPVIGGLVGKSMYLNRAFRRIHAIEQMPIGDDEKRELVEAAGGISWFGAALGGIAVASAFGMMLTILAALIAV